MTVINVIRHADAVHVLTDGGAIDLNEGMMFSVSKVYPVPQANAVFAFPHRQGIFQVRQGFLMRRAGSGSLRRQDEIGRSFFWIGHRTGLIQMMRQGRRMGLQVRREHPFDGFRHACVQALPSRQ